jgi:hypothetical protein
MTELYVGSQNDGLAIISRPPRPAPVDHVFGDQETRVIAKLVENDSAAVALAHQMAAAPQMAEALRAVEQLHAYRGDDAEGFAEHVKRLVKDALTKAEPARATPKETPHADA